MSIDKRQETAVDGFYMPPCGPKNCIAVSDSDTSAVVSCRLSGGVSHV